MNLSGQAVVPLLQSLDIPLENFLAAVDQMDLPPGKVRFKNNGSNAGHNGLRSLEDGLGTTEFKRLYIGIGRPAVGTVIDHVLGVPTQDELESIQGALDLAVESFARLPQTDWEELVHGIQSRFRDARRSS